MNDIRPCPFCGSDKMRIERDGSDGVSFYVICNECLSQGPCSLASEEDALGRWNERWMLSLWEPRNRKEATAEIERLRGELDALQIHFDIKSKLGDEKDAEIERLREENSTFSDSLAAKADRIDRLGETVARQVAEIERLRSALVADDEGSTAYQNGWHARDAEVERLRRSLDDHLDSEAAETRRADRERDRARTAEAEIERLRGLLREARNDVYARANGDGKPAEIDSALVLLQAIDDALGE